MSRVITATATNRGGRETNADAVAVHYYDGADITTATVVDGIGNDSEVVQVAAVAAQVIARTTARTSPVAGIMAAAGMVADPVYKTPGPDAVAVVAMYAPGRDFTIGYIGDCRAYSWDGDTLTLHTEDHTIGQQMRLTGADEAEAREYDNRVRTSLAIATIGTVLEIKISAKLVVLTSDGVHDALDHDRLTELVRRHAEEPQDLADSLVAEAVTAPRDDDADVDNVSAVVLLVPDHLG